MVTALAADLIESSAAAEAARLPLSTRFELGDELTPLQRAFLDKNGFCIFAGVAKQEELDAIYSEVCAIQERWLTERRKKVYGIPLFAGKDPEGRPFIQRFAFTSNYSDLIREFVTDQRFEPIRRLIGEDARVGHEEKDGVVFNRNLNVKGSAYPRLGWHTDGLRSLFYGRLPGPMLNVGLHFDRIKKEQGGLRLIPGSHKQGFWDMALGKPYFVHHKPDPWEVSVETEPGDLTIHDGRLWHRVEKNPVTGWASLRRTMYVPYICDDYSPKSEDSPTPIYHHLGRGLRFVKKLV